MSAQSKSTKINLSRLTQEQVDYIYNLLLEQSETEEARSILDKLETWNDEAED